MPPSRDEVYHLIATAKGDIPASDEQQRSAQATYSELIAHWTRQLQAAEPGELSVTIESVQQGVERAYRAYRQRQSQAATLRRLRDQS